MANLDNIMALYLEGVALDEIQAQLGMEYEEFYDAVDELPEMFEEYV